MTLKSIDITIECDECGEELNIPQATEAFLIDRPDINVVIDSFVLSELILGLDWIMISDVQHYCSPECLGQ
jgi:hypothetical protein